MTDTPAGKRKQHRQLITWQIKRIYSTNLESVKLSKEVSLHILLLLLLSCFSRVRLCATPWTAAHQAPLSLGFSRQEYWIGLPFPSPMHSCILGCFSCVRFCAIPWTAAHQAPLSTGFSRQEYWSALPFTSANPCKHMSPLMSLPICHQLLCDVVYIRQ